MNGMDAVIQIRNGAVKGFSICADKTWGCAERLPLRASPDAFHSGLKIRKSEVVPVNQGFLCCANLCGTARRRPNGTAAHRFPLVPANAGTHSGFPRAREMSERSLDCATRNPGLTARLAPHFVSLNPGHACYRRSTAALAAATPLNSSYALPGAKLGKSGRCPLPAVPKCSGLLRSSTLTGYSHAQYSDSALICWIRGIDYDRQKLQN
jgi:hypothetical protein